ncbi:major facilitator superfamily domain-containing protein [Alternaria rosae]|uniref:major facilitator superfamily domain-containing protein n=1 Tax=Alternaria rosae TaxID=1187941 RepID=UPI001E8E1B6C|nr:major facilitator superfamily domain-containing protein [Alternaria rosae]KAH6881878.1 major facilitator superfamily domain-containing protein [Alternaria rosae]
MGALGWLRASDSGDAKKALERKLVVKLDIFIMVFCCAAYFFNYLDRQAFANAYVAGLREDIGLKGNEYSILLSIFTAGLVVGQIPHGLIIQKVRPSIWLPFTLILWSLLTMCSAGCKNYHQLCAVRFFQGLIEASLYSGSVYVMGSWYKPSEIAKRAAIFTAVGQIGSMCAGLMMTAMHQTMEGKGGLKGWQWVFIIDGLMGIPVGLFGFFTFPDLPESTRVSYITQAERQLAMSRLPPKTADTHNIEFKSLAKRVLLTPTIYILTTFSVVCAMLEAFAFQGMFLLWLKHNKSRFSQTAINTYPLGIQAVAIVSQILGGAFIDHTGHRLPMIIFSGAMQLITASLLLVRNLPDAGIFTAHYLSGTSFIVNPIMYGWATTICQRTGDDAVRGVTVYTMAMGGLILYTWWGIVMYPATDVPYWKKGSITMIVVVFAFIGWAFVVRWLDRKTAMAVRHEPTDSGEHEAPEVVDEKTKSG